MTTIDDEAQALVDLAGEDQPAERRLPGVRYTVQMEDGAEFGVRVLNRDRVSWDRTAPKHKWGSYDEVPFLATTFVVWCAAKREGHTALKFEEFSDAAADISIVQDGEDDEARPTRSAHEPD